MNSGGECKVTSRPVSLVGGWGGLEGGGGEGVVGQCLGFHDSTSAEPGLSIWLQLVSNERNVPVKLNTEKVVI